MTVCAGHAAFAQLLLESLNFVDRRRFLNRFLRKNIRSCPERSAHTERTTMAACSVSESLARLAGGAPPSPLAVDFLFDAPAPLAPPAADVGAVSDESMTRARFGIGALGP